MPRWPDTTGAPPPVDYPHESALWLLGRHPQLAGLVDRIPGAVDDTEGEEPWLDLQVVAEAVRDLDAHSDAWVRYRGAHYEPQNDMAWEAWRAAGPVGTPGARALGKMSSTERGRVRLLAYWAGPPGVLLHSNTLTGFDADGQRLIADWCRAVMAS